MFVLCIHCCVAIELAVLTGFMLSSLDFAENAGMEATDMSFFLSTGIGDGIGVCMGHTAYCAVKKAVTGSEDIELGKELQVGIMLGSAAVCSGGIWQVSYSSCPVIVTIT